MSFLVQPGLIRNAKMSVAKGFRGKKGVDGNPVLPDRTVLVAEPRDELALNILNRKKAGSRCGLESEILSLIY